MTSTVIKIQYEIKNLEIKTTKANKDFASFQLEDTRDIPDKVKNCVMWDKDYDRLKDKLKNGNEVADIVWSYNKEYNNYSVTDIGILAVECKDGLTEEEAKDILINIVKPVAEEAGVDICEFIDHNLNELITVPAAKKHHHTYKGGLMQHTLEVYETALGICSQYKIEDTRKTNILAACVLHDLFKVEEYTFDGVSANYVSEFYKNETSHTLAMYAEIKKQNQEVANLIATHHGRVEWGALREAESMDEYIVHSSDMLSARGGKLTVKDL